MKVERHWIKVFFDNKSGVTELKCRETGEVRKYRYGILINPIKHLGNFSPVKRLAR